MGIINLLLVLEQNFNITKPNKQQMTDTHIFKQRLVILSCGKSFIF
jgi:hypothetical protein